MTVGEKEMVIAELQAKYVKMLIRVVSWCDLRSLPFLKLFAIFSASTHVLIKIGSLHSTYLPAWLPGCLLACLPTYPPTCSTPPPPARLLGYSTSFPINALYYYIIAPPQKRKTLKRTLFEKSVRMHAISYPLIKATHRWLTSPKALLFAGSDPREYFSLYLHCISYMF